MITTHKWTIVDIDANKWVMFYNDVTKEITTHPFQSSGSYTCVDTLVVADTLEECRNYIIEHGLIDPDNSNSVIDTTDL